jgi:S1-C subfamily serine protease
MKPTLLALALLLLSVGGVPALADAPLPGEEALVHAAERLAESTVVVRGTGAGAPALRYRVLDAHGGPQETARLWLAASLAGPGEVRGFFVGDGSAVLTASSAVAGATKVEVVRQGRTIAASVAAVDPDFGLALLRVEEAGPPLEVDASSELEPGRLLVLGGAGDDGAGVDLVVVSRRTEGGASPGLGLLARSIPDHALGSPVLGPDGRVRAVVGIGGTGRSASAARLAGEAAFFGDLAAAEHARRSALRALRVRDALVATPDLDAAAVGAAHGRPLGLCLVPGRRVARALPGLLADGRVRKGYLGIVLGAAVKEGEPLDPRRVARLLPDSPATGKILPGDTIVAVAGRRLGPADDIAYEILALEPGRAAGLLLDREGSEVGVEVVPTERAGDAAARGTEAFGFSVLPLTEELRAWIGAEGEGVVVSAVTPGGAAHRAGLARGDRIVRWADRDIRGPADADSAASEALRRLAASVPVDLEVVRSDSPLTLRLPE